MCSSLPYFASMAPSPCRCARHASVAPHSSTDDVLRHAHRDYTNPYLPVAPFATDPGMLGLGIQAPINANPQEGNVLLAQVPPCYLFDLSVSLNFRL
jgi:hypothetical protein